MTLANHITIARISLIPLFVLLAAAYGRSVVTGVPDHVFRAAAAIVFLIAAVSDALDGFIARKWNMRSRLGAILDPLADKGLLITAILTLTFLPWPETFPLWFPVVVIGRDLLVLAGAVLLHKGNPHFHVRPSGLGKTATATQMAAVAWMLLGLPHPLPVICLASVLTVLSGMVYFVNNRRGLFGKTRPVPQNP